MLEGGGKPGAAQLAWIEHNRFMTVIHQLDGCHCAPSRAPGGNRVRCNLSTKNQIDGLHHHRYTNNTELIRQQTTGCIELLRSKASQCDITKGGEDRGTFVALLARGSSTTGS